MLQIFALFAGLIAWGTLIVSIVKNKAFTRERMLVLRFVSWLCCAVSLYIPLLSQYLEFRARDYDSVIDCVPTYHLLGVLLLVGNAVLTGISVVLQNRKQRGG